jgi:outer membrane protein
MKRLLLLPLLATLPAGADDLAGIYRQARDSDPVYAQARANRDATIEKESQGRSQLLPSVNLQASTIDTRDQRIKTPISDTTYDYRTNAYALTLTQPIYRRQNFAAYYQGKADAAKAEFDFIGAEHDLILRTTQAYLNVLAAEDVLEFARSEKASIERLMRLSRRGFDVGTGTMVDVNDAQARYDIASAQEIAAVNDLEVKRESLRTITGGAPVELARLTGKLDLGSPQPADMQKWVDAARADNPRVKSSEQALESAKEELEKTRGGHHPTLDLTASRSYSDATGSTYGYAMEVTTNQIGLVLNIPILQGGFTSSKVREAYARREESAQRLEQSARQAAQQAREAYLTVINGTARVQALEQAQASNQRSLESTVLGYERGVRNGSDVLNSQRQLYATRRDLSQARYDLLLSRLRLKAAVGTLGDADVADINGRLGNNRTNSTN